MELFHFLYLVLTYADVPGEDDVEGSSLTSHDMDTPPLYPGHHPHKGLPHVEMVRPAQDTAMQSSQSGAEAAKEEKKKSTFLIFI